MSVRAQSQIWQFSKAKGGQLLVLLAIGDYAHDDGRNAWPSMDSLAKKTRMTERGVRMILRQLEALGELRIRENADRDDINGFVPRRFMDVLCVRPEKIAGGRQKVAETLSESDGFETAPEKIAGDQPEDISGGRIRQGHRKNPAEKGEKSGRALKEEPLEIHQEIRQSAALFETRPTPAALASTWNTHRQPGPKVNSIGIARLRAYSRALRAHPDLADWERVIVWLNGQAYANAPGSGEHATWRADLDWLAKPGQLAKLLERLDTDAIAPPARPRRLGDLPNRDGYVDELQRTRRQEYQREQDALEAEAAALVLELPAPVRKALEREALVELENVRDRVTPSAFDDMVLNALPKILVQRAHGRPLADVVAELEAA